MYFQRVHILALILRFALAVLIPALKAKKKDTPSTNHGGSKGWRRVLVVLGFARGWYGKEEER